MDNQKHVILFSKFIVPAVLIIGLINWKSWISQTFLNLNIFMKYNKTEND